MGNLTSEELLNIIIALDNEAANNEDAGEAAKFRNLKWKVFALFAEAQKAEDAARQPPQCSYCGDNTCAGHCA